MNAAHLILLKIRRLAGRALVRRVTYANKIRYLQIQQEGGVPVDDIEHFEPFGFTSHPLPNSEAIVLAFNGNGSHAIGLLVGDQRYRLVIAEGESAIYNNFGDKVHIKKDRTISVEAAVKVIIDTPEVEMTGKLTVAQSITAGTYMSAGTYISATTNVLAGANMTAVGIVKGAILTNTAGTASMAEDGTMSVKDVYAEGVSLKGHVHSNGYNGGNTGAPV